ncbi:glycoside hydrolase family 28 protein [Treponema parvum]|uniref:Glycoside hydrolase family 28 protein n=1 Tax=Treponema parvum TaxID=138851 RepID=A0A975IFF5_9SPIR|nr:glycoside hydrolase family 28 protein [Treponema parvum]QTQ14878.1 glycoside hydrolase family 28 protein [Treponema parvum]
MQSIFLHETGGRPSPLPKAAAGTTQKQSFFDNSEAFFKALDILKKAGGGTLKVASGVWHTGPIELFSNITLHLEEGAVISFIPEPERYKPVYTRWEGADCFAMHPCVYVNAQKDVKITGNGTIDGQGLLWWRSREAKKKQTSPETPIELEFAKLNPDYKKQPGGGGGRNIQFLRPPLIQFYKCKNCSIEDITACNSPFWTIHPVYSDSINISNVTVQNPAERAPNTDGIDIDSCTNVTIIDCSINVGDDAIALKSGADEDGIKAAKQCRNIRISNCTVFSGHGGIVIGSETAAGIEDVVAENCVFKNTDRGIRIKTRRGRGGAIKNLQFSNLTIKDCLCPFSINMYYVCGADPKDPFLFSTEKQKIENSTPSVKDISVNGIKAAGCRSSAGFIAGLPESPVCDVVFNNCVFETDEKSSELPEKSDMTAGLPCVTEKSFRIVNAKNVSFKDTQIIGPQTPFLYS